MKSTIDAALPIRTRTERRPPDTQGPAGWGIDLLIGNEQ